MGEIRPSLAFQGSAPSGRWMLKTKDLDETCMTNHSLPNHSLTLKWVAGRYGVARLAANADIPPWAHGPGFSSITRADDELTIVCLAQRIPAGVEAQRDWACLRTLGPFASTPQALSIP